MRRRLGDTENVVAAPGLGCMGMSWGYAEGTRNDETSVKVIRKALDIGVDFFDTANVYGDGHNEELLGRALGSERDCVVLATKVGLVVDDLPTRAMHTDGTPEHVRASAEESLRRLGVDHVDLLYLHRVDTKVPLMETWGALKQLVDEGKARYLGLSEVSVAEASSAHDEHPVTAIQSELSLWSQDARTADSQHGDVVGWCAEKSVGFVPFAPLGRGFLSGEITSVNQLEESDFRYSNSRYQDEVIAENLRIVDTIRSVAEKHGVTPAQISIAWTMALGDHVIPIPGTKKLQYLVENFGAGSVHLTVDDMAVLAGVPAAVGSRYGTGRRF